jgi:Cell division protein FtsI/penicillin-binding protein 2
MRSRTGLRYSIKTRYIDKLYLPDYVFVQDVSMELITSLKENNVPGFEVTVSYTRQYHTNLAAHLLGYTGKMNAEEYTTYKTQGYPMSATVGKDGAELAFEKYLHGTNGTAIVTKNASGTVTGTTYTKEPEPGDQVSLTIDLDLQAAAEQVADQRHREHESPSRRKPGDAIRRKRAHGGVDVDNQNKRWTSTNYRDVRPARTATLTESGEATTHNKDRPDRCR